MPPDVLQRLNIRAMRMEVPFVPENQHATYHGGVMLEIEEELRRLHAHNVTVLAEFGTGPAPQPLGRPRPHLDAEGVMLDGKMDHVWLPEWDGEFKAQVKHLISELGWPKGPITGVMLWNEPWEGHSISGWQADMLRYRELYKLMGEAVHEAEAQAGVQVLVGGCDSHTNTLDKLFPDGSMEFLPYLDFCSIHYQGLQSPAHFMIWRDRQEREGRVLIFDTESWVANTDDRYAGVVAANHTAGYDRAMGVYGGNVVDVLSHRRVRMVDVWTPEGRKQQPARLGAYTLAASVGAVQQFIGDRPFRKVLFERGLPWVFVFDGMRDDPGDGTVVVLGDLEALFTGGLALWSRTATTQQAGQRLQLLEQLRSSKIPQEQAQIQEQLAQRHPYTDAKLIIPAEGDAPFAMYDFQGNRLPAQQDGTIVVPLDHRGFFLRATDGKAASFAKLLQALDQSQVRGLEPVHIVLRDFLKPVDDGATLRLELTSHHNQPIDGELRIEIDGLEINPPGRLKLKPRQVQLLEIPVRGQPRPDNEYLTTVVFDAGDLGMAVHHESMHVNRIIHRSIAIDGNLEDWQGAYTQTVAASGTATRTLTEAAWLPFEKFTPRGQNNFASAWLAYDQDYFYFAARITDDSVDPGTLRFASAMTICSFTLK
ncbi:MAG: hypothetical protein HC898_09510 [Phycisphaerales bacterium]|nr:hypothetical protein [Phycisphaerales bacterium]